jgi:hypothetical protein
VDREVIRLVHGDASPLANIIVNGPVRDDRAIELETDKGLDEMGYEQELTDLQRRYQRPTLKRKEGPPSDERGAPSGGRAAGSGDRGPQALDVIEAVANERPGFWARLFGRRSVANETASASADPADVVASELLAAAMQAAGKAAATDLQPLAARIAAALEIEDDEAMLDELIAIHNDMPELFGDIARSPALAAPIADALTAALVNGAAEAFAETAQESAR